MLLLDGGGIGWLGTLSMGVLGAGLGAWAVREARRVNWTLDAARKWTEQQRSTPSTEEVTEVTAFVNIEATDDEPTDEAPSTRKVATGQRMRSIDGDSHEGEELVRSRRDPYTRDKRLSEELETVDWDRPPRPSMSLMDGIMD